jgi:hypothetical protein
MAIETAKMREAAANRVAEEELRSRAEMEMEDYERGRQRWRAELTSNEAEAREAAEMENGEMRQGEQIRRNREEESQWSEDSAPLSYSDEDEREDEVGEHEDDVDNNAGTNDRLETQYEARQIPE